MTAIPHTSAWADSTTKPPPALKAMVTSAIDNTILPAYRFFANVSAKTRDATAAWCKSPSTAALETARQAFAGSVHGWARIQHIRFGPARTENRWQRIAFLPDPRGVVRRQVAKVMAERRAELLTVDAISRQSAALQGLPALEILLYAQPADEPADGRLHRCSLAQAIAGYITRQADNMVSEWTDPQTGWRQRLLTAGAPGNTDYRSPNEAAAELVRSLLTGLQLVREDMLLPDGNTLCVANGGIETHPDAGRAKFNLDTMTPSIAFIDAATGDLKAQHALAKDLHQLSLRHMCRDQQGSVWFGGQWEGGTDATPWLVGRVGIDTPVAMPEPREITGRDLKGYIGSMASSSDGRIIAASAPRAGRIVYFDAATARVIGETRLADACGIAPAGDTGIACTTGEGIFEVSSLGDADAHTHRIEGLSFDNHLRCIA